MAGIWCRRTTVKQFANGKCLKKSHVGFKDMYANLQFQYDRDSNSQTQKAKILDRFSKSESIDVKIEEA